MNTNRIVLIRALHPTSNNPPLESNKTGKLSYMGQILRQLGQPTLGKEQKQVHIISDIAGIKPTFPFSQLCHGKVVQTDLATQLISSPPENEARISSLLEAAGFVVEWQ